MGALFAFTLKTSLVVAVLFAIYRLIVCRWAGQRLCRIMLIGIFLLSPVLVWICGLNFEPSTPTLVTFDIPVSDVEVDVVESTVKTSSVWLSAVVMLWLTGCLIMTVLSLFSWLRLRRVLRSCRKRKVGGIMVAVSENMELAPFSTARHIVVTAADYGIDRRMILRHELQHIRLCHWIDLMIARIYIIIMWYNPAVWLLAEELKQVHEFEVDGCVLAQGTDARSYQYMLLAKATGLKISAFSNSLNNGSLKRRFTMMAEPAPRSNSLWAAILLLLAGVGIAFAADALPLKGFDRFSFGFQNEKMPTPEAVATTPPANSDEDNAAAAEITVDDFQVVAYGARRKEQSEGNAVKANAPEKSEETVRQVDTDSNTGAQSKHDESKPMDASQIKYFVDNEPITYDDIKNINKARIASIHITKSPEEVHIYLKPDSIN